LSVPSSSSSVDGKLTRLYPCEPYTCPLEKKKVMTFVEKMVLKKKVYSFLFFPDLILFHGNTFQNYFPCISRQGMKEPEPDD